MQDRRYSVRWLTQKGVAAVTALLVGLVAISASLVGLGELASGGLSAPDAPSSGPRSPAFDATTMASVSTTPVEPKVREIKVPTSVEAPREAAGTSMPEPDRPSAVPAPSVPEAESAVVAATRPARIWPIFSVWVKEKTTGAQAVRASAPVRGYRH